MFDLFDDRYGYPKKYLLAKCSQCGHKFLQGNFTRELLTSLYTEYYPRSTFSLDQYKTYKEVSGLKAWLDGAYCSAFRWVPKNVCVLDIGCGFGETLGYHQFRGCDAYGVEVDENIRRVADKFGYKIHVGLFDSNLYESNFFDYITMDQVIEHVCDPLETMRGIAKVLKPGGVAILSTPNSNGWGAKIFGRYWINWHTPYHLQFFSVHSMKLVAEQAGLNFERVKTITNTEWLYYQWTHLLTFPKVGEPSIFWYPHRKLGVKEKVLFKLVALSRLSKMNHIITCFFDTLGMGDNYLFFLRKK
ncbi:MAG: class I SAM-dependent methyltransferase [Candidatus Loosdrechtia sp.]|uniref:class I SAM-dependent methyltransferase n=1 Tax=Candidatus Loosdrechtia sp. TaxID=3101272 RepID=UPI003A65516F|nr:MAG: class I SAM-dependent methyltransferase [Candidatus Jettenia sp. AMX2]